MFSISLRACSRAKKALTATLVAVTALSAQFCLAKADNSAKVNSPEYCLKVIYFIPTTRKPIEKHIETIKNYVKLVNKYYSQEMARSGYFKPGTTVGKTFSYETEANGEPHIIIMNGKHPEEYYQTEPAGLQWGEVYDEVVKVYPANKNTFLVFSEAGKILPDQTIVGDSCGGGEGDSPGGAGGFALMGSDCLPFLDPSKFMDNTTSINGLVIPELGPYPLKHDVSYGGFANPTVGGYNSTCFGASAHELGHAFNMPHVFVNDYAPVRGGQLMGCGNQGFRGNFSNNPGEYAHIFRVNCDMLNAYRLFNPGEPLWETKKPKQVAELTLQEPCLEVGRVVHVRIKGSDSGSGLYKSVSIITPPWSTIKSAPFNADGIAEYDIYPMDVPYENLKPKSYNFEFLAMDKLGNRSLTAVWVPVPDSQSIQCFDGGKWRDLPNGCVSPSKNVKFAVSMTSQDGDVKITPEIEVLPANVPFTGKSLIKGDAVEYKDKPVMGYIDLNMAPGAYHYRYRLVDSKGKKSCWIQPKLVGIDGTDFVIE